jgi:hypothetical protein
LWISIYAKNLTDIVGWSVRILYPKDVFEYGNYYQVGNNEIYEISPFNGTTPFLNLLENDPTSTEKGVYLGSAYAIDYPNPITIGSDVAYLGRLILKTKTTVTTATKAAIYLSDTRYVSNGIEYEIEEGYGCSINGEFVPGYWTPVELLSFEAISLGNNEIELNWETASETNNLRFDIMRSRDGVIYEKVSSVPGHGTTTEPHSYSYIDKDVNSGDYYYRLRQVDTDGTTTQFEEKFVSIPYPDQYELGNNYPNPFNPSTSIPFSLKEAGKVKITIYNILGQEIKVAENKHYTAGMHKILFNGKGLTTGVYFYRLEVNGHSFVKKFTLIK